MDDFANLLGMAGNASATFNNVVSALAQLTKLAKAGKLPPEAAEKVLTLSVEVGEAKLKLALLQTEIVELQRAQDALDELKQRKQNYELWESPTGDRVYRLKDDAGTGEIAHKVCPNCFERDQIVILQGGGSHLRCTSCINTYQVREIPPPTLGSRRGRR